MTIALTSNSPEKTIHIGDIIGRQLQPGDVVALFGDLGSGKTQITKGICQGLACTDEVSSPTFTLINEYEGRYPIYHFDLYRIDAADELFGLGYEEYFGGNGVCIVEWAERAASLLPDIRLEIYLEHDFSAGNGQIRHVQIAPIGNRIINRNWDAVQSELYA